MFDIDRINSSLHREEALWHDTRPRSREQHSRALASQLHGTPTYRTNNFPTPFPIFIAEAEGAEIRDLDGHGYVDFSLCGSAALFGHRNPVAVKAMKEQMRHALVIDWPTDGHIKVAELMAQKFGLPIWQFSLSAADANRFALRLARIATGRPKILVFNHTYHGSLDETHAILENGQVVLPKGVSRNGIDVRTSTAVANFNDADEVTRLLSDGEIAAVLVEPAITTRQTIVMPSPTFHARLREVTRATGTLLIVDETQTIVAGPGGFSREFGLEPDMLTMGKWLAGGLPVGMYGMSREVAAAVSCYQGEVMGSTLAGNALSVHVMEAVLSRVITEETFGIMRGHAQRYGDAIAALLDELRLPWHVARLGARVAFGAGTQLPRSGVSTLTGSETALQKLVHKALWFFLANRGVLFSGWDCTSLFCPLLKKRDVDLHIDLVQEAISQFVVA